ncbi:7-carboxy-7-deazaguanine synthase QueE [Fuerstiella marisgermanici]|uniref:7-carboxy-7-deazaguanine synthase n=1 Tax=Fuerstiella marisgermanici TaxID=1891926 RepID=A0A1P8WNK4_9PLAN|nr:7-carboxy-7-deazaguanine synthase QueE [Fuerstiella marisgermanici]APZ95643.1 7-carboxy-7-deazaguanine synthase [Fuerstiella marisgermanici]
MFISETYESFQGEGPFAETSSLFIRTSGCNLRCSFCDTPYTSWHPEGDQVSLEELAAQIAASTAPHVVLTGGEPMLAPQLSELTDICRTAEKVITIETAGTVDRSVECDLMAISPKLRNSTPDDAVWSIRHEETRHQPAVIRSLFARYDSILKFVIDVDADVAEVEEYLTEFPQVERSKVWLMPQARTREELSEKTDWVRTAAESHGFQFSSRLHVEKFGNMRGV